MSDFIFLGQENGDEIVIHKPCGEKIFYSELEDHACGQEEL